MKTNEALAERIKREGREVNQIEDVGDAENGPMVTGSRWWRWGQLQLCEDGSIWRNYEPIQ